MAIKNPLLKHMLTAAAILGGFAILGTGLVGLTFETTKEQIAANEREYLLRSLNQLVPEDSHDNDIYADHIQIDNREWLRAELEQLGFRVLPSAANFFLAESKALYQASV